jgi:hypothetical protein
MSEERDDCDVRGVQNRRQVESDFFVVKCGKYQRQLRLTDISSDPSIRVTIT